MSELAKSIAIQAGVPVIEWGEPGIGKTERNKATARTLGRKLVTVILSIREPSDLGGLPIIQDDGTVKLAAPHWTKGLKDGDIVFFDEASTAPPAMQAAALRVVCERIVGDTALPNVSFVLAANPPECAAGGFDLSAPMANRMCHLQAPLVAAEWAEGILSGFPDQPTAQLPKDWEKEIHQARALVSSFIHHRPALLHALPKQEDQRGQAWPSPRSWDYATRLLAAAASIGHDSTSSVVSELLSGMVGAGVAIEFINYMRELDLPDPEDLLEHPENLKKERADRVFAALNAVVAAVIGKPEVKRWNAAWKVVARTVDLHLQDVGATAARALIRAKPQGAKIEAIGPEIKKFQPILVAAGLWA